MHKYTIRSKKDNMRLEQHRYRQQLNYDYHDENDREMVMRTQPNEQQQQEPIFSFGTDTNPHRTTTIKSPIPKLQIQLTPYRCSKQINCFNQTQPFENIQFHTPTKNHSKVSTKCHSRRLSMGDRINSIDKINGKIRKMIILLQQEQSNFEGDSEKPSFCKKSDEKMFFRTDTQPSQSISSIHGYNYKESLKKYEPSLTKIKNKYQAKPDNSEPVLKIIKSQQKNYKQRKERPLGDITSNINNCNKSYKRK